MAELLTTGKVFDLLVAFIAIELAAFCGYRLLRQEHPVPIDVYLHMVAALGLLGAARSVFAGAWWGLVGLQLAGALFSHAVALALGWRRRVVAHADLARATRTAVSFARVSRSPMHDGGSG